MTRPRTYTIAAILMVLYSLLRMLTELPNLMAGAAGSEAQLGGEGPPFVIVLFMFVLAVLGLVSSFGVWRMMKWGVVLTLILAALHVAPQLLAVLFAPPLAFKLGGGLSVVWCIAIIVLLLWPHPKVRSTVERAG